MRAVLILDPRVACSCYFIAPSVLRRWSLYPIRIAQPQPPKATP